MIVIRESKGLFLSETFFITISSWIDAWGAKTFWPVISCMTPRPVSADMTVSALSLSFWSWRLQINFKSRERTWQKGADLSDEHWRQVVDVIESAKGHHVRKADIKSAFSGNDAIKEVIWRCGTSKHYVRSLLIELFDESIRLGKTGSRQSLQLTRSRQDF